MRKTKLIKQRKLRGYSQENMADMLEMDKSSYHRRETGKIPIADHEWERLAEILDCKVKEIFEDEKTTIHIIENNGNVNAPNRDNNFYTLPKEIIEPFLKYTKLLEEKIKKLENDSYDETK